MIQAPTGIVHANDSSGDVLNENYLAAGRNCDQVLSFVLPFTITVDSDSILGQRAMHETRKFTLSPFEPPYRLPENIRYSHPFQWSDTTRMGRRIRSEPAGSTPSPLASAPVPPSLRCLPVSGCSSLFFSQGNGSRTSVRDVGRGCRLEGNRSVDSGWFLGFRFVVFGSRLPPVMLVGDMKGCAV